MNQAQRMAQDIRELRAWRGYKMGYVCKLAKVNSRTLARIENGLPVDSYRLLRVIDVLGGGISVYDKFRPH